MLADSENGLIALIKGSPIGARLRQVDALPDLEGDSLVQKFATDAPAAYLAPAPFQVRDRNARLQFGIACVAKNSRSHQAARQGDGMAIGLYELLEGIAALVDGARTPDALWRVVSVDFLPDERLFKAGVYAGVIRIETAGEVELPAALDDAALADFTTFHADVDVTPHDSATEHGKWLQEPPDYSTSRPDVSETSTLSS